MTKKKPLYEIKDFLDVRGHLRTTSLFRETIDTVAKSRGYKPLFTLREFEVDGLPSMHNLFMEDEDVTGMTTCMRTVGVWRYWQKIWSTKVLKKHMDAWVAELEVKMMSEAIQQMRESTNPTALRYLAEKGWTKKAGRPSKKDIEQQARVAAALDNDLADDAHRIQIVK